MSFPKISIITPSFNQGGYIGQTIDSVLNQGYPNLEYIVIDGGSEDNTVEILNKYHNQISYWVSEPDAGQTDAINKGFQKATGDIINWINSDDYYDKDSFFKLAASFKNPSVKAVTTVVHNFDETGLEWDELLGRHQTSIEYITRTLNNQPGTFFRKELWDRYFPLPVQLRYTMDQYLWFCFWLEHRTEALQFEKYITAFFRRHAASKTTVSLEEIGFNYLGKAFFNEHNLILWSYFFERDKSKADIIAGYFWDGFDYHSKKISFPGVLQTHNPGLDELFQLYLFQLVKEDFRHGFFERLKASLRFLDAGWFQPSERKVIQKMKFAAISPNTFRAYRRIYWKLKMAATKS